MATLLKQLIADYGDAPDKVVALIEAMGQDAVAHLLPSLTDPVLRHRIIAAQLLAQIGDKRCVPALIAALPVPGLPTEPAIQQILQRRRENAGRLPSPLGISHYANGTMIEKMCLEMHASMVEEVREAVLRALGQLGDRDAIPAVRACLTSPAPKVREPAQVALHLLEGG